MLIVNTPADLAAAEASEERTAFLTSLLNDEIIFDDAVYPEGYDQQLHPGDDGYIKPVIRKEWNAGAAAAWGFGSKAEIEAALS